MHPFLIYLCLSTGAIVVAIGAMFGEVAALNKSSMKAGCSIFVASSIGGLLCSLASFFIGGVLAYPTVLAYPEFNVHNLSVLSLGIEYGAMSALWLILWLCGSVLGAILGGVFGLGFYQFRQ